MSRPVAVVTGGSRGIGAAIARRLAPTYDIVIVSRGGDIAALQTDLESQGSDTTFHAVDVSHSGEVTEAIDATAARYGRLDALIAGAGVCPLVPFEEITDEVWDSTLAVNLSGTFYAARAAANAMINSGSGGSIVAISSISAHVGGPFQIHYTPTKAGQLSLMQSMAVALAPHGIRCNTVSPGTIVTDMNRDFLFKDGRQAEYAAGIPMGRLGEPQDIAGAVSFLIGPEAAYITGSEILVDGGALAAIT